MKPGANEAMTETIGPTEARPDRARVASMSGLEIVEALAAGKLPRPPMAETIPFTLLPPSAGQVTLLAQPERRFMNLTQTMHGGWSMTLLDTAMALAAQTMLRPGGTCPSHETTCKFLRPITRDIDEVRVMGTVLSHGRKLIAVEGRITDGDGRLLAHGTSTCIVRDRE